MTDEAKTPEVEEKDVRDVNVAEEIAAGNPEVKEGEDIPLECTEPKEETSEPAAVVEEQAPKGSTQIVIGNTDVLMIKILAEIRDILVRLEAK